METIGDKGFDLTGGWREQPIVAFDTETTGQYPLSAEICEFAAVKWLNGKVVDEFQTLLRPSRPMDDFVISIHHITNEMVAEAPKMSERVAEIHQFLLGAVPLAHHAPFDLGFLAIEFEQAGLSLPEWPVMCSSLLARNMITSPNHRLQTLVKHLQLPSGQAHRALDDAHSSLGVALHCLNLLAPGATWQEVFARQTKPLYWQNFSLVSFCDNKVGAAIVEALRKEVHLEIVYMSGSQPGRARQIKPEGLVRNAHGDYLVGSDFESTTKKRFYVNKIQSASVVF